MESDRLPAREWSWEGNVQASVISWLAGQGWQIRRVADTKSREHGTDVVAQRGGTVLHAEVKGWPSANHVDPRRADEQKRSTASGQTRVWFADPLMHAMRLRDANPYDDVAIVFPRTTTYEALTRAILDSLHAIKVAVLFVDQDETVGQAAQAIRHAGTDQS